MLSMCVMDIMNVLRTGMNISISHIHVWLCDISTSIDAIMHLLAGLEFRICLNLCVDLILYLFGVYC